MGRTVRLSISGHGGDTDAPTVEDALDQIRDYLEVLRGVEEAVAEDGTSKIVWRIVNASKNSPLAFEIEAFPRDYGVNIDRRAQNTIDEVARGFARLQSDGQRPSNFTDKVLGRVQQIFERVTNGLSQSDADFGNGFQKMVLTPLNARTAARNTSQILKPADKPYKELGSIEGFFKGVEQDGYGRRVAFVKDRVTGDVIKCLVSGSALLNLEGHQIEEVWHNRRVQVSGKVHYRTKGKVTQVEAATFRFFRSKAELPQVDDIIDPGFTGGLRSEDYLEKLRSGELS